MICVLAQTKLAYSTEVSVQDASVDKTLALSEPLINKITLEFVHLPSTV